MEASVLRFRVLARKYSIFELDDLMHPEGEMVLNGATWNGRPPRTCRIGELREVDGHPEGKCVEINVAYRSPEYVEYLGNTRYQGWDICQLCERNGIPVGKDGEPIDEGAIPYYDTHVMYGEINFNELDFGEFLGETPIEDSPITDFDQWWDNRPKKSGARIARDITFLAALRSRPTGKVFIASNPDRFRSESGTRLFAIDAEVGHLRYLLPLKYVELMSEFLAGQISLDCISTADSTFVKLADTIVDATQVAQGSPPRLDVFDEFITDDLLVDVAKRLTALFHLQASVIGGQRRGLLLRHSDSE